MHPRTIELLDYLDRQRIGLRSAFLAVPDAVRSVPPAPQSWSAVGVIEHLALVETRIGDRLAMRIADARAAGLAAETEKGPVIPTLDLGPVLDQSKPVTATAAASPRGLDAESAWVALQQADKAVRTALISGDGLALGTVIVPHPRFGPVSLYYWFAFIGAHEARHTHQIQDIATAARTRSR